MATGTIIKMAGPSARPGALAWYGDTLDRNDLYSAWNMANNYPVSPAYDVSLLKRTLTLVGASPGAQYTTGGLTSYAEAPFTSRDVAAIRGEMSVFAIVRLSAGAAIGVVGDLSVTTVPSLFLGVTTTANKEITVSIRGRTPTPSAAAPEVKAQALPAGYTDVWIGLGANFKAGNSFLGTFTSGNPVVTITNGVVPFVGQAVTHASIPAGTTVLSVGAGVCTLSANPTASQASPVLIQSTATAQLWRRKAGVAAPAMVSVSATGDYTLGNNLTPLRLLQLPNTFYAAPVDVNKQRVYSRIKTAAEFDALYDAAKAESLKWGGPVGL